MLNLLKSYINKEKIKKVEEINLEKYKIKY